MTTLPLKNPASILAGSRSLPSALVQKFILGRARLDSQHTIMAGPRHSSCSNNIPTSSGEGRLPTRRKLAPPRTHLFIILAFLVTLLSLPAPSYAVKFELPASYYPTPKCIWNYAHKNALIVITANVGPGKSQRVDVEVRDREGGPGNIYLSKRDIKGETRLAVTAHADGDVGVCFKNILDTCACMISLKGLFN